MITIKRNINEEDFIEGLLNMKYSEYLNKHILLMLSFYALGKSWNYNKFIYYLGLLEEKKK